MYMCSSWIVFLLWGATVCSGSVPATKGTTDANNKDRATSISVINGTSPETVHVNVHIKASGTQDPLVQSTSNTTPVTQVSSSTSTTSNGSSAAQGRGREGLIATTRKYERVSGFDRGAAMTTNTPAIIMVDPCSAEGNMNCKTENITSSSPSVSDNATGVTSNLVKKAANSTTTTWPKSRNVSSTSVPMTTTQSAGHISLNSKTLPPLPKTIDNSGEIPVVSDNSIQDLQKTSEPSSLNSSHLVILGVVCSALFAVLVLLSVLVVTRRKRDSLTKKISLNKEAKRLDMRVIRRNTLNDVCATLNGIPSDSDIYVEMNKDSSVVV